MNKAAVAGIIAAIVIGIGVAIAVIQPISTTSTQEPAGVTSEVDESGNKEFKVTLEEKLGIEGTP